MGQDVITRPDWTPVSAASTILGQGLAWSHTAAAAVEVPADLSPNLAENWQQSGGVPLRLAVAQGTANSILAAITEPDEFQAVIAGFDALPASAREAIIGELSLGTTGSVRSATETEVKRFGEDEDGAVLVAEWRGKAPRNVAAVRMRLKRILGQMSAEDATATATWFGELPAEAARAVLRELGR